MAIKLGQYLNQVRQSAVHLGRCQSVTLSDGPDALEKSAKAFSFEGNAEWFE